MHGKNHVRDVRGRLHFEQSVHFSCKTGKKRRKKNIQYEWRVTESMSGLCNTATQVEME